MQPEAYEEVTFRLFLLYNFNNECSPVLLLFTVCFLSMVDPFAVISVSIYCMYLIVIYSNGTLFLAKLINPPNSLIRQKCQNELWQINESTQSVKALKKTHACILHAG